MPHPNSQDLLKSFGAYRQQTLFRLHDKDSIARVTDVNQVQALVIAVELARKICTTSTAIRTSACILGEPASPAVSMTSLPTRRKVDDDALDSPRADFVRQWFEHDCLVVTVRYLKDDYASFYHTQSKSSQAQVFLDTELVIAAGLARSICGEYSPQYRSAYLHMAVCLSHELQHAIRFHYLLQNFYDSPPRIRTASGHEMGDTYDPDLFCGESEWYWEEEVIGGSLCRITLDDENDPVWRFKNEVIAVPVRLLDVPPDMPTQYFLLQEDAVSRLCSSDVDELDEVLPLERGEIIIGDPDGAKWRGRRGSKTYPSPVAYRPELDKRKCGTHRAKVEASK